MAQLIALDITPTFEPKHAVAAPDRLVEGNPQFQTWELDTALAEAKDWGKIRTGIWEATPGTSLSIKAGTFEFCHILSGRCEITEDGGAPMVFGPGDSFVMKPAFKGTWRTLETLRKIFVIAS